MGPLSLAALALLAPGSVQNTPTRASAEALLRKAQVSHMILDEDLAPYKKLGAKSLSLFAPFLIDKDLGALADFAMEQIDSVQTTRYMLEALPKLDRNTQSGMFSAADRAMEQFELFQRSGSPNSNEPPPRYPRNHLPYPFKNQVHDAAIRILMDKNAAANGTQFGPILLAVGLSGRRGDAQLIRKFVSSSDGLRISDNGAYALAALAHLGDRWAIEQILKQLATPATSIPAERYFTDRGTAIEPKPGMRVTPEPVGQHLRAICFAAGFSMNRVFLPSLISHLDDAPGQRHGDYADPSPAMFASDAIACIVTGNEYGGDPQHWKQWWATRRVVR